MNRSQRERGREPPRREEGKAVAKRQTRQAILESPKHINQCPDCSFSVVDEEKANIAHCIKLPGVLYTFSRHSLA